MKKQASIVIGLGFGDEGKGLTTDYLCSQTPNPLVIRFNGGQQAGHTVCTTDGRRHVFSSFGAGTLRGAATYWSAYCTVSLAALLNEYQALTDINISPRLFIDENCAVTTHYDVLFNRLLEKNRGGGRHGSCGMGFGTTVQREERGLKFKAVDLLNPEYCSLQLKKIRTYYSIKAQTELNLDFNDFDHQKEDDRFVNYVQRFHTLLNHNFYVTNSTTVFNDPQWDHYVFEGAQGMLLDMDFGYFPHVTRSNTSSKNALELICSHQQTISTAVICYVSRIYHTRHGEGPFVQYTEALKLHGNEQETNVFNDHQGGFRTGPLDLNQVNYALKADASLSKGISSNLVLTCLDQVDTQHVPFTIDGKLRQGKASIIPGLMAQSFHQVLTSSSCDSSFLIPAFIPKRNERNEYNFGR